MDKYKGDSHKKHITLNMWFIIEVIRDWLAKVKIVKIPIG